MIFLTWSGSSFSPHLQPLSGLTAHLYCTSKPAGNKKPQLPLTDITSYLSSRFYWCQSRFTDNFLIVKKNKTWRVFHLILDHSLQAKCVKFKGQNRSFLENCQVSFVNKNILIPTFQYRKGKVLTCQCLLLLEEITHYMQCLPLKERNLGSNVFFQGVEIGFCEVYLSKSALKGCHVIWHRLGHSQRSLNCKNQRCNFPHFFTSGILL